MIRFPNCKINLGLNVMARRSDGYHDLESVIVPVPWWDVLEIIRSPDSETRLLLSGLPVAGAVEENLCIKAFRLLEKEFGIQPVHIYLHKVIPSGAGLGGGSSDGAFTLLMLNELFTLRLDQMQLKRFALMLGSDCPFFIDNRPALATGRGDILKPVSLSLDGYYIIIIKPEIHISTASAYTLIRPCPANPPVQTVIRSAPECWRNALHNDFEDALSADFPVIAQITNELYGYGAVYASLSGSGSAVYGLFREKPENIQFAGCTQWQGMLSA